MSITNCFLGCNKDIKDADILLIGIPYDGTSSFRPGSRFAPNAIRETSYGIETYSPIFDKDIEEDLSICDIGDMELPFGNFQKATYIIEKKLEEIPSKKVVSIGGEHLITLPIVKNFYKKYNDIYLIHFDAHADLRDDYLGEKLSHATVIRRIAEIIGFEKVFQYGIRSGTKDEYNLIKKHKTLNRSIDEIKNIIGKSHVYISVDLDVLDPSIFPGTGTPEPGGFSFNELINFIRQLDSLNIVGCDVVELSPHYDNSGVSTIVAAKVIRELFYIL
jgi:agmatinase